MAKSGISVDPNTDTVHAIFQYTPNDMLKHITAVHAGMTGYGLVHKLAQLKPEELEKVVVIGMNGKLQLLESVSTTVDPSMLVLCQT